MTCNDIDYFLFGTHLRLGDNVSLSLANELSSMGKARPIILTQTRIAASAGYRAIVASLAGMQALEVDGIPQHSSVSLIETIRDKAEDFGADCIVAIGGGSVSDSAKAVGLLLAEGGSLAEHATTFTPPDKVTVPRRTRPKLPIIAIPTTASGAETTPSFGVRDEHGHKLLFWNRQLAATSILIDPLLNADVPLEMMRCTAMNGIAHCLEGMYSKGRSVVSDGIALQAMGLFKEALADDAMSEAGQRRTLLLAGHLSGMVLSMARSCLHHAICHVIGAACNVGHGVVNTVMLPHAIRFNADETAVREQLAPVLDLINAEPRREHSSAHPLAHSTQRFDSISAWLLAIVDKHHLPSRLSALGVKEQDFDAIARQTMTERGLAFNPRLVADASDIKAILRQAF